MKKSLLNFFSSAVPDVLCKTFLPDNFILYGHLVSNYPHVVSSYYNYPSLHEFDELITWLKRLGYKFVGLHDYLQTSPEKKILLTFDDGFKVIFDELHPYMRKNKIPYALFVLTNPLVDKNFQISTIKPKSYSKRLFLNEEEIIFLKNEGVHIGFHTRTHLKIENSHDTENIKDEISIPLEYKHLFSQPLCFAYPYMAPLHFQNFNKFMAENYRYEYFFDTKGFAPAINNHFFRVSIDSEFGVSKKNKTKFIITRQLLYYMLKKIKNRW